jgi:signal transduction histidine kinase
MGGDIRFSGKYAKDEIGVLAEAFDDLLSRIRASMQREKEFTQDVSHELRTPLMALSTSLDLLE